MKKLLMFCLSAIVFLTVSIMPNVGFAQFGPINPPFWESGGVGGFGDHVPKNCKDLDGLRSKISSNGLLGTIHNVGEFSQGQIGSMVQDGLNTAINAGVGVITGGLGNVVGSMLGGILGGGGDKKTKKAIEELTKVQMTNLVEAECHSILQDIYLTMLEESQMEKLNGSEYRNSDIEGAIEKVRNARDDIGYLREYIADEYRLLYDIRGRHEQYEQNPGYWREVRNDFADYSIEEADDLIIEARENQLMTGQTKEYIDVLTGMLGKDDLTPGQTQQLEGYISAVHASETTELKNILSGQARLIAQMEVERQQEEKDQAWFRLKRRENNALELESFKNAADGTERRSIVPAWAGESQ